MATESLDDLKAVRPAGTAWIDPLTPLPATLSPDRSLLHYYALSSLMLGPFFLFVLIPYFFRFRTMRYKVDEEGITMRWGLLFRREISLTYARIQDIHLSSNFVERWLGLSKIQVQTASASAKAEMTIEGMRHGEQIRDFLYTRMRGARDDGRTDSTSASPAMAPEVIDELTATLRELAAEIRALRQAAPGGRDASDA